MSTNNTLDKYNNDTPANRVLITTHMNSIPVGEVSNELPSVHPVLDKMIWEKINALEQKDVSQDALITDLQAQITALAARVAALELKLKTP